MKVNIIERPYDYYDPDLGSHWVVYIWDIRRWWWPIPQKKWLVCFYGDIERSYWDRSRYKATEFKDHEAALDSCNKIWNAWIGAGIPPRKASQYGRTTLIFKAKAKF